MDISSHPSVEELVEAVRARGGTVACNVCSGQEFSIKQVQPMAESGGYGERREHRTDLMCENCGHVMGFEIAKLRADRPA